LGTLAAAILRYRQIPADRDRGPEADRRTLRDRGRDPRQERNQRRAVRQENAKPLTIALKIWLEKTLAQVARGSSIARAIRYGLNRWDGLVRFLDDGRIEIDSNTERSMRPIALTRKNALFAGSDEEAKNWAMLASLIETCKLHGVNPEAYPTNVLTKLVNNWPNSRLSELTPWAWAAKIH
jgi:transposase